MLGDDLDHHVAGAAGHGGHDLGDARVGLGGRGDLRGVGLGRDDLQRAGRALAEGVLHLGVGGARAVALGHDLDRRHAGLQAEHGDAQRDEDRDGDGAVGDGPAPQALGPGGEARRAVLAGVHPRQRELVHARAELGQHGGQQRERRREDEDDREHDAERHRPERGRRHEHHRAERDEHGQPGEQDGLAGGVHRLGDGVLGRQLACRRTRRGSASTMNSA